MERSNYKLSLKEIEDQIEILDRICSSSITVTFKPSSNFPHVDEVNQLFKRIDEAILQTNYHLILVELQLISFLTIIQGLTFHQAIDLDLSDWHTIDISVSEKLDPRIATRNHYCSHLISHERIKTGGKVFKILNLKNAIPCLNMYMVLNGYQYVLSPRNLKVLFGRFLYARYGQIKTVKEFLKDHFKKETHIDLLMELQFVDTITVNR